MRRLLDHHHHHHNINGMTSPTVEEIIKQRSLFGFPSIPFTDNTFDLATISLIISLVLLSAISFAFIIHLQLRSRRFHHLQNFNSIWGTRLLLITFAFFWALNEAIRLPILRRKNSYPFFPTLSLTQQSDLCKLHVAFSFGLFQPGFLVTLLLLINIAIQKRNPHCMGALCSVSSICIPLFVLQLFFVFHSPLQAMLPRFMHASSYLSSDIYGNKMMLCTYPLFSCIIFSVFAVGYSFAFLLTCWRISSFVINKSIRKRVNLLSFTVMLALPLQILCNGVSPMWFPQDSAHALVALVMFLAVAVSVAVGEVILVIRPIADALAAGGDYSYSPDDHRLKGNEIFADEPKTEISRY